MKKWSKREERHYELHGGLINVSNNLDCLIADVIAEIPDDEWEKITHFSFFMDQNDASIRKWGTTPEGYDFDYEISFSESLENDEDYARYVIAHEFAHLVLGHADNPLPFDMNDLQGLKAKTREEEADLLAEKWGFVNPSKKEG